MLLQNPISFIVHKELPSFTLEYRDFMEICQGGPEVGDVYINETKVKGYSFGGPFLIHEHHIILPAYIERRFKSNKFKLAFINTITLQAVVEGDFHNIIFPFKLEDNVVHCYTDLNGKTSTTISMKDIL